MKVLLDLIFMGFNFRIFKVDLVSIILENILFVMSEICIRIKI